MVYWFVVLVYIYLSNERNMWGKERLNMSKLYKKYFRDWEMLFILVFYN